MTTAEITALYGVPMPETCKELNFMQDKALSDIHEKYKFIWIVKEESTILLCRWALLEGTNRYYPFCVISNKMINTWEFEYPAPQMHEIAKLLPTIIRSGEFNDYQFAYDYYNSCYLLHRIKYSHSCHEVRNIVVDIVNFHFAQAYAELFLKLKSLNLL